MAVKKEGVTYDEIVRSVRAGNFAPVYYLMGEEAYYIDKVSEFIVDTALKEEEKDFNLTVCYGTDVTADEVINAAKRFPMMAERQVVLVREAQSLPGKERLSFYLEHPQPSTVLIFAINMAFWIKGKSWRRIYRRQESCLSPKNCMIASSRDLLRPICAVRGWRWNKMP